MGKPDRPDRSRHMLPSERREFVRSHRTCVFGYARRADGPSMSIVYYIPTDEDELLISTMRGPPWRSPRSSIRKR